MTVRPFSARRALAALVLALAAGAAIAAPARADDDDRRRGHGWGHHDRYDRRDHDRDHRYDRRHDDRYDHRYHWRDTPYRRDDWRHDWGYDWRSRPSYHSYSYGPSFTLRFGDDGYRGHGYSGHVYLRPRECRWEVVRDHWLGRPADVERRVCANAYGEVYIVAGSHRFVRYW